MKKVRLFYLLGLVLLFPQFLTAQDLTRQLLPTSSTSIIRQWDSANWVCYNYGDSNEFYIVSSTGASTPCMSLKNDSIRITDFEIFNDVVYFCGYMKNNAWYAMMGRFSLFTFPNSLVTYDTLSDVATFDKMDVFSAEEQVHVVMTAKQTYDGGQSVTIYTIVDAAKQTDGSWLYSVLDNTEKPLFFDDVAVTDNFVVYTARSLRDDNYKALNTTELWYFDKPTTLGTPVLTSSVNLRYLYNWPDGQVLIEHLDEDRFVIAGRKDMDDLISNYFIGFSYNGTCKVILDESIDTRDVLDIKYNGEENNCDVLVWRPQSETWTSRVFTIPISNHYNATSTVGMRTFKDVEVQSIDFLTSAPNYFIASGCNIYVSKLNVCKYNQLISGRCFSLETVPSKHLSFKNKQDTKNILITIYGPTRQNLPTKDHQPDIETICN